MRKSFSYSLFVLILFLFFNVLVWRQAHTVESAWANVPPAPKKERAAMIALGDEQLAYRYYGLMLQNLGSTGGHYVSLKEVNYAALQDWLFVEDYLDPISNHTPMLAAQYYGGVDETEKLDYITEYLEVIGTRPYNHKWRWLAQAVFIARHVQKNNNRALVLAYKLAGNKDPDMSVWAKQMPVFILNDQGDTDTAYKIMLNILIDNVDIMAPEEINYMRDYICNTLLEEQADLEKPEFCKELTY